MKQQNAKNRRKKEKWNFKPYLIIAAVILLIVGIVVVVHFVTNADKKDVLEFTYDKGKYYDEKNDITYEMAPFYYQSQLMTSSDYPYAESNLFTLYRVGYRDANNEVHLVGGDLWLSTSMDVGALLYYNPDKVDLPELDEYEGDTIYVCEPDGSSLFSTTALKGVEAEKLIDDFVTSEENDFETHFTGCQLVANLKISSSKYKWLYLNLWLYTDGEGEYYLYEQVTQKFLETDADIFEPFFETTGTS